MLSRRNLEFGLRFLFCFSTGIACLTLTLCLFGLPTAEASGGGTKTYSCPIAQGCPGPCTQASGGMAGQNCGDFGLSCGCLK